MFRRLKSDLHPAQEELRRFMFEELCLSTKKYVKSNLNGLSPLQNSEYERVVHIDLVPIEKKDLSVHQQTK